MAMRGLERFMIPSILIAYEHFRFELFYYRKACVVLYIAVFEGFKALSVRADQDLTGIYDMHLC